MFAVPHRGEGFGRMNAHQLYAQIGFVVSFGLLDRTLVDWYIVAPTLEENLPFYNGVVFRSILVLTPFYLLWCVILAFLFGVWRKGLYRPKIRVG
jgi:hypothetical protein